MSSAGRPIKTRQKGRANEGKGTQMLLLRASERRLNRFETPAAVAGFGRRCLLQAAVGSTLLTLPMTRRAAAQNRPIRIGVLTDLSGWGRDNGGPGSVYAASAAARDFKREVGDRKI